MILETIKKENLYVVLLSSVAFTIPFPMLINNLAIIGLCIYWLFLCFKKQVVKPNLKTFLLLSIPYSIILIGSFNSSNIHQLGTELTKSLPFIIIPLIALTVPEKLTRSNFKTVLKAFVIGNVIISLFLFGVILYNVSTNGLTLETLWSLTHQSLSEHVQINAIYLSMYLALALIVLIYYFQNKEEGSLLKNKILNLAFISILVLIMIFLSSRTVLFSSAVLITILFFQKRLKKESFLMVTLRFLVFGVILFIGMMYINPVLKWRLESVFDVQDTQFTLGKEEGIKMREKLWSSSIDVFKENWLFGVGSGDFKEELESVYKSKEFRIQYRHHMNSHNQFLSYLVSNGVIGLLMFLIYMAIPIRHYIKNRLWLLVFISLLFACCFMTESYLYTNKGVIVISFFVTFIYIYSKDTLKYVKPQNNL